MSLFVAIWYLSLNQLPAGLPVTFSCDSACLKSPVLGVAAAAEELIVWVERPLLLLPESQSAPLLAAPPARLMPKIDAKRMAAAGRSSVSWGGGAAAAARLSPLKHSLLLLLSVARVGFSVRLLILSFSTDAGHSHCSALHWTQTSFVSSWRQSYTEDIQQMRQWDRLCCWLGGTGGWWWLWEDQLEKSKHKIKEFKMKTKEKSNKKGSR